MMTALNKASEDNSTAEALNPDFESPMTLVDWKNFSGDETLDMYQKADYNQQKASSTIKDNKDTMSSLNDTITNT